jgi:hypothetical protein
LRCRSVAAVGAGDALELAAAGPPGPLLGEALGAFGAAGDGGHSSLRASRLSAFSSTTVR